MVLDRRRHARQIVDPDMYYVELAPNNGGWLFDISEGGLALRPFFLVVSGQAVCLEFPLPGTPNRIEVNCQIAWTDKFGRKAGLRFLDLPEASHQLLREWLSARTHTPARDLPEQLVDAAKRMLEKIKIRFQAIVKR